MKPRLKITEEACESLPHEEVFTDAELAPAIEEQKQFTFKAVYEKAQSDLKKELIEWAEKRIVNEDDPFDCGYNMATRSLIRKLKK